MGKCKIFAEDLSHKKSLMDEIEGEWIWCLHCERAYHKKDMRWNSLLGLYMCWYEGCSGDAWGDGWDYDGRKVECGWDAVPIMGKVYPLYKK
jgi:hypothetical protein